MRVFHAKSNARYTRISTENAISIRGNARRDRRGNRRSLER